MRHQYTSRFLSTFLIALVMGPIAFAQPPRFEALLSSANGTQDFNGVVLAAKKGEVVYEGAVGLAERRWSIPHAATTRWPMDAGCDPWMGILAAQMMGTGVMNPDAPIASVFPQFKKGRFSGLTMAQLLQHRSGLSAPDILLQETSSEAVATQSELLKHLAASKPVFEPGAKHQPEAINDLLIRWVIEKLGGEKWSQLVERRILRIMGAADSGQISNNQLVKRLTPAYHKRDASWTEAPFLGLRKHCKQSATYTTARDLLRFDRALRSDRLLNSEASQAWLATGGQAAAPSGLGYRIYDRQGQDAEKLRVMEWQAQANGYSYLMIRGLDEDFCLIVLSNTPCAEMGGARGDKGLAADLLGALLAAEDGSVEQVAPFQGRWHVTLYTGGAVPTGETELVINQDAEGAMSGTFYYSEFRKTWKMQSRGQHQLAFITGDASNDYYSTMTLKGGRLEGFTLCPGRDFLSTWTAVRVP